jgi:hypothetical protein
MQDTVNNSVVIVDDRMLVTLYSHIKDFGSKGITLDLSNANDRHNSPLKNA